MMQFATRLAAKLAALFAAWHLAALRVPTSAALQPLTAGINASIAPTMGESRVCFAHSLKDLSEAS